MDAANQIFAHNHAHLQRAITVWAAAALAGQFTPGSLGSSPVAHLLRAVHELSHDETRDIFTLWHRTDAHDYSFTWWTYVREHGLANRENRKPHGYQANPPEFLTSLGWPLWVLFELDQVFDEAVPFTTTDEVSAENLLDPDRTFIRLEAVLNYLLTPYPLSQESYTAFRTELRNGCQ